MKRQICSIVCVVLLAFGCTKEYKYGKPGEKGAQGERGIEGESSQTFSQTFVVAQKDWLMVSNFEQREVHLSLPMLTQDIYDRATVQAYKLEERDSVFYERSLPILSYYPDYSWTTYRVEPQKVVLVYDELDSYTKLPPGDTAQFRIVIGGMGL